ncbi:MAG: 50S ribosomal protein L9 [Gemmatimonadetes bacterium]|nr:50S ribosomal protein L9 [Gemmatimonadota bacterium]
MQVILRKSVEKLGHAGDTVKVAAGYARNYLVPRGLAFPAGASSANRVAQEKKASETRLARARDEAVRLAAKLDGASLTFAERAGEEGQLYGSVGAERIAEGLAEMGHPVQRRHVQLEEPIKALGVYDLEVRFHPEAVARVQVRVVQE